MNVLVTVGTTSFQSLIDYVSNLDLGECEFVIQTGPSTINHSRHTYFEFSNQIEIYYQNADIIISHAGAGSTFKLLTLGKPVILVPNMERVDKHQSDLAVFMEDNQHVLVAWDIQKIPQYIDDIANGRVDLKPYKPIKFFAQNELMSLIVND